MELGRDFYVGIVEDNKDPNRKGRIKVRVQTLYHTIPIEDIPYAYPFAGIAGKEFQVPAIGKLVNVLFLSDDLYSPYYIYSENYNVNLQNKLKDLSDDDYVDFSALLFDEKTQIYVKNNTLTIDQLLNKITIDNSTINLELKDNNQKLNLGTKNAEQNAVLGKRFFEWMDKFIKELMNPNSLIGNMGAPVLKTKLVQLCQEYQQKRPDFISNNVWINDNGHVDLLKRYPDTINSKNDIDLIMPPEQDPSSNKVLSAAIQAANDKACENLKNSAPSSQITLPDIESSSEQAWSKNERKMISTLHPKIQQYATRFINKAKGAGISLKITDAYRSVATQQQYLSQGKPAAQPGYSFHNYGLAIDVKPTDSTDWETIGQIGKSLGFRWGKTFTNPKSEPWHFDMGFGFTTAQLKAKVESGDLIANFVNLGGTTDTPTTPTSNYNGQNYVQNSISTPCDAGSFNNGPNSKLNNQNTEGEATASPTDPVNSSTLNTNCQPPADLVFSNFVKENKQEFLDKVRIIADKLAIDPNDLMSVMFLESGLDSHIVNKLAVQKGIDGATGLIQFMPDTARELGTTTTKLKNMTNVEQLDYVYKYFLRYKSKLKDFTSLYMVTFYPVSLNHQTDNKWIFGSEVSMSRAQTVRNWNPGFDLSGNGYITISDFKQAILLRLPLNERSYIACRVSQNITTLG